RSKRDWSSDVCSSDLLCFGEIRDPSGGRDNCSELLIAISSLVFNRVDRIQNDKSSVSSVVLASDDTPKTLNGLARLLAAGEHNCKIRIGDIDALVEEARSTQNL